MKLSGYEKFLAATIREGWTDQDRLYLKGLLENYRKGEIMSQKKNVKVSKKSVSSLPSGQRTGPKVTPTPVTYGMGNKKVKSC